VVLCMSPSGKQFRNRLRQFPSLVNCCTMDWFGPWPKHALLQVGRRRTVTWEVDQRYTDKMAEACVHMHLSEEKASARFLSELKRHNYTTPTSYLELLNSYDQILKGNGLINCCQAQQTKQSFINTYSYKQRELDVQQKEVEGKEEVVRGEEAIVTQQTNEAESLAEDSQKDLSRTL
ncbi:MAG: putative dynein heavy chain, partial [Streblomastix strix]